MWVVQEKLLLLAPGVFAPGVFVRLVRRLGYGRESKCETGPQAYSPLGKPAFGPPLDLDPPSPSQHLMSSSLSFAAPTARVAGPNCR